jgi:hypothetical protein
MPGIIEGLISPKHKIQCCVLNNSIENLWAGHFGLNNNKKVFLKENKPQECETSV